MTHRQRKVFVLEYEDPSASEGWSILMCNTSASTLAEHRINLPSSTKYRIIPYEPARAASTTRH